MAVAIFRLNSSPLKEKLYIHVTIQESTKTLKIKQEFYFNIFPFIDDVYTLTNHTFRFQVDLMVNLLTIKPPELVLGFHLKLNIRYRDIFLKSFTLYNYLLFVFRNSVRMGPFPWRCLTFTLWTELTLEVRGTGTSCTGSTSLRVTT